MSELNNVKQMFWVKSGIAATLILIAAVLRIVPHPWNLTPIGAIALFSGAALQERWIKVLVPLAALFVGDIFVGFHVLMPAVYLSFLLSIGIGAWVGSEQKIHRIALGTLLGAVQFFFVTNFAVWAVFTTYPKNLAGLTMCYVAGLPLFWNTLAGDVFFAVLLFGGYALGERFFAKELAKKVA